MQDQAERIWRWALLHWSQLPSVARLLRHSRRTTHTHTLTPHRDALRNSSVNALRLTSVCPTYFALGKDKRPHCEYLSLYMSALLQYKRFRLNFCSEWNTAWKAFAYTIVHKFWAGKRLQCFAMSLQGCIYLIKNIVKTVILWHISSLNNGFLFEYILKCNLYL